jgi:hypothetical protein
MRRGACTLHAAGQPDWPTELLDLSRHPIPSHPPFQSHLIPSRAGMSGLTVPTFLFRSEWLLRDEISRLIPLASEQNRTHHITAHPIPSPLPSPPISRWVLALHLRVSTIPSRLWQDPIQARFSLLHLFMSTIPLYLPG